MTTDRWRRVEQLYHAALARDADHRAAFLAEACASDEALRREVESLLAQPASADVFLAEPAVVMAAQLVSDPGPSMLTGHRIGAYQVQALLGAGGMGEVYRARDTKLGRDVAIKILPRIFTSDPERLARFEREARLLASLNHPHIGAIYGVEGSDGVRALILELVDGPTLADRLAKGPIPLPESLGIARQIADALEAAHERGIVHRDLKPANIKITPDGIVKVLDFGLAKLAARDGTARDLSQAPTVTVGGTREGVILGTAAYMSPEQARGLAVDKQTDIWAFGCVLFEMLTGRAAFAGDTLTDTLAAILERKPSWTALPHSTPAGMRRLLQRCLEKDPKRRLHDIADVRIEIDDALIAPADEASALRRDRLGWGLVAVLAVVSVGALGLGAMAYFRRAPVAVEATRFVVSPPEGWNLARQTQGAILAVGPLAVAPDGRRVAFVARNASGRTLIWLRSLDTLAAQGLAGTEGAGAPFWSPDSRSLGFFAGGKLKTIDVAGGPPVTLCDAAPGLGGTWSRDGVIVFSPTGGAALQKVSASGGVPTPAERSREGEAHIKPAFLPDGRHFLYRVFSAQPRGPVFVASLDSTERTRLMDIDSTNVLYSQRHLLFLRETTLMAQPFDPDRLALAGEPFPVAEQIQTLGGPPPFGLFSVSDSGVLAYQTGTAADTPQLTWLDRAGKPLTTVGAPALYRDLGLSPDGKRASVSLLDPRTTLLAVWLLDLERDGLPTRFTFDAATAVGVAPPGASVGRSDWAAIWSPDGSRVVFSSDRKGHVDLYQKASSGAGGEDVLLADNADKYPNSWSPDGRFLLYGRVEVRVEGTRSDLWVLPLSGDRKPFPFLRTPANESGGRFSPDGRWIAYTSDASGREEVYVAPFSGSGGASGEKWQVSTNGGSGPRWRQDGREIFYITTLPDATLMAAAVTAGDTAFHVGAVAPLFAVRVPQTGWVYQVSPDGRRFLVNMSPDLTTASAPITVVVNWTAGLKK